jgi:hypothetical protein
MRRRPGLLPRKAPGAAPGNQAARPTRETPRRGPIPPPLPQSLPSFPPCCRTRSTRSGARMCRSPGLPPPYWRSSAGDPPRSHCRGGTCRFAPAGSPGPCGCGAAPRRAGPCRPCPGGKSRGRSRSGCRCRRKGNGTPPGRFGWIFFTLTEAETEPLRWAGHREGLARPPLKPVAVVPREFGDSVGAEPAPAAAFPETGGPEGPAPHWR